MNHTEEVEIKSNGGFIKSEQTKYQTNQRIGCNIQMACTIRPLMNVWHCYEVIGRKFIEMRNSWTVQDVDHCTDSDILVGNVFVGGNIAPTLF